MAGFSMLGVALGVLLPAAALLGAAATVWRGLRLRSATLLGALAVAAGRGLSLADELDDLAGTLLPGDRTRVGRIAQALRAGEPLPTALHAGGGLIPASSAPALAAGAATGTLPRALRDEAARLTRVQTAGGTLWGVLMHFGAVALALAVVVGYLSYQVVPKYKKILSEFGAETGPAFDSLTGTSDLWWTAGGVVPLAFAQLAVLAVPALFVLHQKGHRLPWVGRAWGRVAPVRWHAGRLGRALAAAAEAGRPWGEALDAYAAHANARRGDLRAVAADVAAGGDVWTALRARGVFDAGEARLAAAGQAAGNLPAVLRILADRADAARARRFLAVGAFLQPVGVLALGAAVAWVALAFFGPLVSMQTMLGEP